MPFQTKVVLAVSTVPPVVNPFGLKVALPPIPPPNVPVKSIVPAFADISSDPPFELIDPETNRFPPTPLPDIPVLPEVVSKTLLPVSVRALPIIKSEAVNNVPFKLKELGEDTVSDPNTVKTSAAWSLMIKVPVLLKVRL